ncbi:hypothetical protein UlMin_023366 [Ulmus minor]
MIIYYLKKDLKSLMYLELEKSRTQVFFEWFFSGGKRKGIHPPNCRGDYYDCSKNLDRDYKRRSSISPSPPPYQDYLNRRSNICEFCSRCFSQRICNVSGMLNFFHCWTYFVSLLGDGVGCCYSILLNNSHPCVEGVMHHDCPVCSEQTILKWWLQFLFESRNDVTIMPCGHTIHTNCLKEMREHYQYACPLCLKLVCNMSKVWEKFDMEITSTPIPEPYQNKLFASYWFFFVEHVWILCNDCGNTLEVHFHMVAQKCPNCKSSSLCRFLFFSIIIIL